MTTEHAKILAKLQLAYGKELPEDAATIYLDAISEIPVDVLSEACAAHIRSSQWFPRVSELLSQARHIAAEREAITNSGANPWRVIIPGYTIVGKGKIDTAHGLDSKNAISGACTCKICRGLATEEEIIKLCQQDLINA